MSRAAARHVRERLPLLQGIPDGLTVPSPCNCTCRLDACTGWCDGCLRTIDEIAAWSGLDNAGKRVVWARLEQRAEQILSAVPPSP